MKITKTENLKYGVIRTYEKGDISILAYETKDPIGNQVILVKQGDTLVSIEAPLFKTNVEELNDYINSLNVKNLYILLVDHVIPQDYLVNAKAYTAKFAINNLKNGGPKGLFNNFKQAFGDQIQSELNENFNLIDTTSFTLGNIKFSLIQKGDEFDVVVSDFNAVYTHMLGHDVHSIIGGNAGADAFISELEGFIKANYDVIFTSHYIPETIEDVKTKIAYIKNIKEIASKSKSKEEFISKVKDEYPSYSGLNYLDITASIFFN